MNKGLREKKNRTNCCNKGILILFHQLLSLFFVKFHREIKYTKNNKEHNEKQRVVMSFKILCLRFKKCSKRVSSSADHKAKSLRWSVKLLLKDLISGNMFFC